MRPARVLVADRDPTVHSIVKAGLASGRYEIAGVSDGQEALKKADLWKPDVILLEVALPRIDGVSLIRILRSKPDLALVPAIFLDDRDGLESRISGFKLGADDFMPKPLQSEDLDARIAIALNARDQARNTVQPPAPSAEEMEFSGVLAGFRGTLTQIGLPSLLSLMELERKIGVLVLILEPEQEKVRIFIRDGRVLQARYDKRPVPRNAELLYHLFSRTEGKFDFRPRAVMEDDEIRTPTARLLLEGARLLDETRRHEAT